MLQAQYATTCDCWDQNFVEHSQGNEENLASSQCLLHLFATILTCFAAAVILKSSSIHMFTKLGVMGVMFPLKFLIVMCIAGETIARARARVSSTSSSANTGRFWGT